MYYAYIGYIEHVYCSTPLYIHYILKDFVAYDKVSLNFWSFYTRRDLNSRKSRVRDRNKNFTP